MRRPIDTAPKNGQDIWLEDATGAVEVGHWSPEAGRWVWQDGSPINGVPTHWYLATEDVDPEDERSGGSFLAAAILIPAILVGASALGVFGPFGARPFPETTRVGVESVLLDQRPDILIGSPALLRRDATGSLMEEGPVSVMRAAQRLDEDALRSEALANELAAAQRELDEAVQRTHAAEVAVEELRKSLRQEQARSIELAKDLAGARGEIDNRIAQSRNADDAAAQQRDAAAGEIAELQQSLQQERQKNTLLVRQADAAQAAAESAEQQRREAQARAAALASELAGRARGSEAEAADQSRAAERDIAELRQSLPDARQKNADLIVEAKAAQAAAANAERQRHAIEEAQAHAAALATELAEARREIETRNERLREANDGASQQREAANREIVELRQSLQQERTETRERALASAWSLAGVRLLMEQTQRGSFLPTTQHVDAAVADPPTSANQIEAEARLIPRARALLDQGNIGAARIVLELAAEKDIAQASFMLAETYDPAVLSAWGTYGTRGEEAKAKELYAKAQRGGIREAKERLDALHR